MKAAWALVLAAMMNATAALAAGYDEFTQGITANLRNDSDLAIAAFTSALETGELVQPYIAAAYRGRAAAYLQKDMCAEALADLKSYTALKGADPTILPRRITTELCVKDLKSARRDFEAMAGSRWTATDLWDFSRLEWQFGFFAEAAADAGLAFRSTDKSDEDAPYMLLWQVLNADRAGKLDRNALASDIAALPHDNWPSPLLELYLGKLAPDDVNDAASAWRASKSKARRCEADFYVAQWHLAHSNTGAAVPLLQAALTHCPDIFIEHAAAYAELKRQGVEPMEE